MSADGSEHATRWVSFEVAGQLYGLPILGVQEVLASAQIEPVPGAPAAVLGVLNLRGSIVTVLDLRRRLGLTPGTPGGHIIVVQCGAETAGLAIDRVADVLNILPSAVQVPPPSPAAIAAMPSSGLVQIADRVLTLLDPAQLLRTAA